MKQNSLGTGRHTHYRAAQLFDRSWPSILHGQYYQYTDEQNRRPPGFRRRTWISDAVLDEHIQNNRPVKPEDWDGGKNLFFREMMAPEGHLHCIIRDLKDNIVPEATYG